MQDNHACHQPQSAAAAASRPGALAARCAPGVCSRAGSSAGVRCAACRTAGSSRASHGGAQLAQRAHPTHSGCGAAQVRRTRQLSVVAARVGVGGTLHNCSQDYSTYAVTPCAALLQLHRTCRTPRSTSFSGVPDALSLQGVVACTCLQEHSSPATRRCKPCRSRSRTWPTCK